MQVTELKADTFQQAVLRTANADLPYQDALTNAAMGISGEAGEYIDMLKKNFFHGHTLDVVKCEKELGDILFYVAWAANLHGLSLSQVMQTNIDKLLKRYPNGFNSADSLARKDVGAT